MRRRIRRGARTTVSPPVIFDASGSAFRLLVGTPVGPHAGRLVGRWRRAEEPDRAQDAVSVALDGSSNQTWVVSIDSEPWCRAAEFGRPYRLDKTAARRERTPRQPRLETRWPCHTDVREGMFSNARLERRPDVLFSAFSESRTRVGQGRARETQWGEPAALRAEPSRCVSGRNEFWVVLVGLSGGAGASPPAGGRGIISSPAVALRRVRCGWHLQSPRGPEDGGQHH
jgi:hypothetical protein